jgi:hypothetical protein
MQKICANSWCGHAFEITDDDQMFYEAVSPVFGGKKYLVPLPTLCHFCREQRRVGQFNRHFMYRRKSSVTGKDIISIFSPDKTRLVYENEYWWSDAWDPMTYGRVVDLTAPILPQIRKLAEAVPVMAMVNDQNENSPYINSSGWSKNCHWSWGVDYCEQVLYSESTYNSKDSMDCLFLEKGEQCYECVDCTLCHTLLFSQNCRNCHDSTLLFDCIGCHDCFGCVGLRQKQYCYFNEQLDRETYMEKTRQHRPFSHTAIATLKKQFQDLLLTKPHRCMNGTNNDNVTGDYIYDSKNAQMCFDSYGLEDCKYCCNTRGASDCQDVSFWGHPGELLYECMAVGESATSVLFSYLVWGGTQNMFYCNTCIGCKDCFGCAGLRKKQYCIFNKQYSKEEYERTVAAIIDVMQKNGEWGEFFTLEEAPFCYNESMGQCFYPLTKEEVLQRGWKWMEPVKTHLQATQTITADQVPDTIAEIPDDILHWAIICKASGRPFFARVKA